MKDASLKDFRMKSPEFEVLVQALQVVTYDGSIAHNDERGMSIAGEYMAMTFLRAIH